MCFVYTHWLYFIKPASVNINRRIAKEVIKIIKASSENEDAKPIERENLELAKSTLIIARVSLYATIILGIAGVFLAGWYGKKLQT